MLLADHRSPSALRYVGTGVDIVDPDSEAESAEAVGMDGEGVSNGVRIVRL